jgi:hypothetical protein
MVCNKNMKDHDTFAKEGIVCTDDALLCSLNRTRVAVYCQME